MQLQDLLIDDAQRGVFRVHRSTMTSEEVLAFERQRIFERCWLYVGHESEVAQRGSYRRRQVAGRPLIIIRGSDGTVRVLKTAAGTAAPWWAAQTRARPRRSRVSITAGPTTIKASSSAYPTPKATRRH